ncbi:unnamed protein product [Coregonus sp. 'balchen']|nr:unnamed protein product [Coregonus sp. 'balchen']
MDMSTALNLHIAGNTVLSSPPPVLSSPPPVKWPCYPLSLTHCQWQGSRLWRHLNLGRHFDNWLPPSGAPDRLLHRRRHPSHQLIVLLQFPPPPHSHFSRSSLPLSLVAMVIVQQCPSAGVENDKPPRTGQLFAENKEPPFADSSSKEGKPEESEPCTSTDDDSSLAGQEQVVAPGLATPPNNAGEDPTILDPDSDSSLPVPDDSGGAAAKSNSQTKNIKDPGEWPKYMNGSLRDTIGGWQTGREWRDHGLSIPSKTMQPSVFAANFFHTSANLRWSGMEPGTGRICASSARMRSRMTT